MTQTTRPVASEVCQTTSLLFTRAFYVFCLKSCCQVFRRKKAMFDVFTAELKNGTKAVRQAVHLPKSPAMTCLNKV